MSPMREQFHQAVLATHDRDALLSLNALSMEEMLPALASIGQQHRTRLAQGALALIGQIGVPRIAYAMQVVADMAVPAAAPDDLDATGQSQAARSFVAEPGFTPLMARGADDAARGVLAAINPKSVSQNREYWGLILQRGGFFSATLPTRSPDETAATPVVAAPSGSVVVAIYHTHGAGFARINGSGAGDIFSIDDRMLAKKFDVDGYLGTPSAGFLHLIKPPAAERSNFLSLGRVVPLR